jgi:hypothetical protein
LTYGSGLQELQEPCRYWLFLLLKGEAEMPSGIVIKRMFSDIYRTIKYARHNFVNYQSESNSFGLKSSSLTTTMDQGRINNKENINLNMPFTTATSGNTSERRISKVQFKNLSIRFNDRAIDLSRELKVVDSEDKNLATPHELQKLKLKTEQILHDSQQLKLQIKQMLHDCPADADSEDVKQMLRALFRVEFPGMAIETKQLNNIANYLYEFRGRLKSVNAGDQFLSAYLRMTTFVRQNTNADLFEKLSASAAYGGELFFTTVSTRPEWAGVAFKLREKSLELDGVTKGWAKEFLDDYPTLAEALKDVSSLTNLDTLPDNQKQIINFVVEATKEKRKLAQYENDLIRHAKFEKQNKKSIFSKLRKKPAVDNLFGFGTNNLSLIINAKNGLFKNTSKEFNVSLYLALESRRKLTAFQWTLSKLNDDSNLSDGRFQEIIEASIEARNNVFSSAEKQQIAEKTKLYNISEAEFIESIRGKEMLSFNMRSDYLKKLSFVSGKVLSSKTNISDGLVGIDKPSIWQRLRKNINLTNSQKNFPEIAMHQTNIAFLSGIDSAFENCLGTDPDDKNPPAWDEHNLAAVKRTIKALQEKPERFYNTDNGRSNMDDESKQKRLDLVWNSVALRTALSLCMKDKNLSLDSLHTNLFKKLEELGCTKDNLKKLGYTDDSNKKKEISDKLEEALTNTNQTIKELYNITTSVLGNATEERAMEHLRNALMSSAKPGSFMYLNRSQLNQLNVKGSLVYKGSVSAGIYSGIFEVKITRVEEGFRVIFYSGRGGNGSVAGGATFHDGVSGEIEVGGGYRTFEGAEFLLSKEDFGNNIYDLCEGVVSIIRGKNSDGSDIDFEGFIDRRVSHIRHFTQKQIDFALSGNVAAGGDFAKFDVGIASGGGTLGAKIKAYFSRWSKTKRYETLNEIIDDTLYQHKKGVSVGAKAGGGIKANVPVNQAPLTEDPHIPVTFAEKGFEGDARSITYWWDESKKDKHNSFHNNVKIGKAEFFGSVAKMNDKECREYIRSRFAAVLDISPVDLARLKNGDFDRQIDEFVILARKNDNGLNHFIKAYGVLTFEADAEIKALDEQLLTKRENRSNKKSIEEIEKQIKSIIADRNNYVITKIGLNDMHEGNGKESLKIGVGGKLLGIGAEASVARDNTHWFELQTGVTAIDLPPRGLPVTDADMMPIEEFVTPYDPNSSVLSFKRVLSYSNEDSSYEPTDKNEESESPPSTGMKTKELNADHISTFALQMEMTNHKLNFTSADSNRSDDQGWGKAPPLGRPKSLRYGIDPGQD